MHIHHIPINRNVGCTSINIKEFLPTYSMAGMEQDMRFNRAIKPRPPHKIVGTVAAIFEKWPLKNEYSHEAL